MRLEKTEGTVRLTNQNGKKRTLKEDIRFTNGDVLRTREESYAGVSLDDTKAVMLDEESRAEFYQGKDEDWIEIDLVEGELFFNVEEKLSEDEEFEIHTSTMVMGIRGTSGHVRTQESGEDTLTVTDGTVHVTAAVLDSEDTMETDVSAGSQLRVIPADIAPSGHIEMEVRVISPEELPALPVDMGERDSVPLRVEGEGFALVPKSGAEPAYRIALPEQAGAPLREGERLGTLTVTLGEETIAELPITAAETVPHIGFGGLLVRLLGAMLGMKC